MLNFTNSLSQVPKNICLLGATGSIGESTLSVIRENRALFNTYALVANESVDKMAKLCFEFNPNFAVMADERSAKLLKDKLQASSFKLKTTVLSGDKAINELVCQDEIEIVVAAIVGSKGLVSSLSAAQAGKTILLANKESLVMGGTLFMETAQKSKAKIIPIDSEHNALFQCLPKKEPLTEQAIAVSQSGVDKLILTASGGPFRQKTWEDIQKATLSEALNHPNWKMGKKVTLDSASLMNKGLEVIEAHFLFDIPVEKIEVLIHPQSIVHSLVQYKDGSFLAQLGCPDMRIPIAHALAFAIDSNFRITSGANTMNLSEIVTLTFEKPDLQKFPCLKFAFDCLKQKNATLVILNAANEIAVEHLIQEKIKFSDVPKIIEKSLETINCPIIRNLEDLLAFDLEIRQITHNLIDRF